MPRIDRLSAFVRAVAIPKQAAMGGFCLFLCRSLFLTQDPPDLAQFRYPPNIRAVFVFQVEWVCRFRNCGRISTKS
jgi:hypothetical protein